MQRRLQLPVPLFIGLVTSLFGTIAGTASDLMAKDASDGLRNLIRWQMFDFACLIAGLTLVVAGLLWASNRLSGLQRVMVRLAAGLVAVTLFWYVVRPFVQSIWKDEKLSEICDYVSRAAGGCVVVAVIALTIAARAWTRPASPWVTVGAVLGILASGFATWTPYFGSWLLEQTYGSNPSHLWALYWPVREAALALALLILVHGMLRDTAPALPDPQLSKRGFKLATMSLLTRVFAAIALATIGIGMIKSPGALKMMLVIGPVVMVTTTLLFAWGLLDVDRGNLEGMPRIRLAVGAAVTAWSAGIEVLQMSNIYESLSSDGDKLDVWTVLAPLIALGGVVLTLSAVHRFATSRGDERLRSAVIGRMTTFAVMSLISALMPLALGGTMQTPSTVAVLVIIAAICGIVAVLALAGLLSIAADTLDETPSLPAARIVDR